MRQTSYWDSVLRTRITRRRAFVATGTSVAAAAFLAACGGDDDDSDGNGGAVNGGGGGATPGASPQASGLLTPAEDTFSQAKRGGTLKDFMNAEPRSLDPANPQANLNNLIAETTQALITEQPGHLETSKYELTGALANEWEVAPDLSQITFHIRPGTKWHPIDPVNGREVDSEDVLFSLRHHQELAPLSPLVWQETSGGGFALTPEAPDTMTVVVPLAVPLVYGVNWFSAFGSYTGQMLMYPKEAADPNVLDIRQKVIGTGPFYVSQHEPSVSFTLTRNPDYFDPDFALVDEISMPILPEYAARQVQLNAGEIHFGRPGNDIVRADDLLSIKEQTPDLLMYDAGMRPATSVMTFGVLGENPYKDERVRQAVSMAFDRDLDIEVRFNVEEFEEAGIPVEKAWNSHLTARPAYMAAEWWLDPRGDDFGPNAKFFQHNLEEARKLLAAAGYEDGFEVKFGYPNAPQFDRGNIVEPYFFYLQELGLSVVDNGYEDYTGGYIPKDRDASGQFEGIGYHSVTGTIPSTVSPVSAMVAEHLPSSGVTFHGYNGGKGDPRVIELLDKAKVETDIEARKALLHDVQRQVAGKMWNLLEPGGASGFMLAWPAVKNVRVWDSAAANWEKYQIWLDTDLPPFA